MYLQKEISRKNILHSALLIIGLAILLYFPLSYFYAFFLRSIKQASFLAILLPTIITDILLSLTIGITRFVFINKKINNWFSISFTPELTLYSRKKEIRIPGIKELYTYCIRKGKAVENYCFIKYECGSILLKWHSRISRDTVIDEYQHLIRNTKHKVTGQVFDIK